MGGMETEERKIYRLSSKALIEGGSVWVAVKTVDPNAFAPRLRAVAAQLGPDARLTSVSPLDVELRQEYAGTYFAAFASAGGVLLSILLSVASLTAVMAVAVAARTREVGIRLAIGASRRAVCATLFGRAAGQLVLGSVIGSGLFVLVATQVHRDQRRLLDNFQGPLLEPLFTVAWVMILVGLVACAIPAQHALRIHPLDAIRE
jgi:ABC-type antimicrobial peptide transport system permease subunit